MAVRIELFQRHPDGQADVKGEGELAYFGLTNWWLGAFAGAERARIEALFEPPGAPRNRRPLTTGRKQSDFRNAADLLTAVAGCLRNEPEDRPLALRVLAKAEERAKAEADVLALHRVYQEMIGLHHRWRRHFPEAVDLLFGACYRQIAIAPDAAGAWGRLRPEQALPTHSGFQMMAGLLEREESYARAIEICKQARAQGWSGNWTWRIGRLAKKLGRRGHPVRSISPSGLGRV